VFLDDYRYLTTILVYFLNITDDAISYVISVLLDDYNALSCNDINVPFDY
jgi:hypothetical protein